MGRASILPVARHLADLLSRFGFTTVWPQGSYAELERVLETGEAHAAWAPPVLCARVENAGGATVLRAQRMGSSSYRSALLCRGERSIDLKSLNMRSAANPIRAAWVAPYSAAGYLMPRRHLRNRGARVEEILDERFHGSFRACFDAVIEGDADLTASYVGRRGSGYIDLCGDHAAELRVLAWTDEIPNDGIVVGSGLSDEMRADVTAALDAAFRHSGMAEELCLTLDADGFEVPDPFSYEGMNDLLSEAQDPEPAKPARSASRSSRPALMRLGWAS
jgi:phosphonate transport system substrate-binding protein